MFLSLLIVTFVIALAVSFLLACLFRTAIGNILDRILSDPISVVWVRYLLFAIYVVGISSGVRILGPGKVHQAPRRCFARRPSNL